MNKQEREYFLSKCLYDAFREQFFNLQKDLETRAMALIPKRFIELINDEEAKEFVSSYSIAEVEISSADKSQKAIACQPQYGVAHYMPTGSYLSERDRSVVERLKFSAIKVPYKLTSITIEDDALLERYIDLWDRYLKAREQLQSLCLSYRSRDKFAEDFPEYKKYLPPKKVAAKMPAVIVADVRSKLAELGVPPVVEA